MSTRAKANRLGVEIGQFVARRGGHPDRDHSAYRDDPIGFIGDVLRDTKPGPWAKQVEIAEAVRSHPFVVAVGSNASGKDWLAARLALWWTFACSGFVVVTGPTQRQVQTIIMGEVSRAWRRARLPGELFTMALRLDGEDHQRGILALTSTEASKLSGFHAPHLLTILTEAQAVEDFAWEGLLACRTGENDRTLAVGNPLAPEGRFFTVSESAHWHTIQLPASSHPNVIEDRVVVPGGPTKTWMESVAREYGRESPQYVARVNAEFPAQAEDALITKEHVDAAVLRFQTRELEGDADGQPYSLGLDPAGPGEDASVLCIRQGGIVREFRSWRKLEAPELAEEVERVVRGLLDIGPIVDGAYPGPGVEAVYVDAIGIGHGVTGILKARIPELRYWVMRNSLYSPMARVSVGVVGVNIARAPGDGERFVRRKDELTWQLREEFVEGRIAVPPSEEPLAEELLAVKMLQTPDGRLTSEPKEKLRHRLGRSPDYLDALALTYHGVVKDRRRKVAAFR